MGEAMTKKLIVFASGTGSNFEALADHFDRTKTAAILALVCDQPGAPVLAKAKRRGIPVIALNYRDYPDKAAAEAALIAHLPACDLIVLAGFMRIIGSTLLNAYPNRIINLHPALLPSFPGRTGIADAFNYGVKVTGVTVHYVDAGIDSGKIIAQAPVLIGEGTTLPELETAIHDVEHHLLPQTIEALIKEEKI
ncbi:phosphoribosylglycinamide formyltransferase [Lacticaseibacillus camelliae DSM 22697 = JCM 13995]|uniref:Phosphoribosylglycinamide formyltransferase n=2 Tax=Lacticaseibacillus camelliae TaxID=381742 RepID=A0A0R2F979_9LACO|nr:phosphoribosylglycinamide formyltransferase [Lacticaseibacillus camelliae DSM 22697 = JCM 13995]